MVFPISVGRMASSINNNNNSYEAFLTRHYWLKGFISVGCFNLYNPVKWVLLLFSLTNFPKSHLNSDRVRIQVQALWFRVHVLNNQVCSKIRGLNNDFLEKKKKKEISTSYSTLMFIHLQFILNTFQMD